MKKRIIGILAALMIAVLMVTPVLAEDFTGSDNWTVTYTSANKLESNFSDGATADAIAGMQPGDTVTFEITLKNENAEDADFWMNNRIVKSMEESSSAATGGAYTYTLTYGDQTLYTSETVGGDDANAAGEVGLYQATDSLDEFFYLDTLKNGATGTITLVVSLDGETQGNGYQSTLAELSMQFAVEETAAKVTPTPIPSPNTGDTASMTPFIACIIAGAAVLVAAIVMLMMRRRREQ